MLINNATTKKLGMLLLLKENKNPRNNKPLQFFVVTLFLSAFFLVWCLPFHCPSETNG